MALFGANVWRRVLGVDRATVIEDVDFDEESDTVVVHVRPRRATKRRCGRCGVRAPGYDQGEGRRNWRALDLGTLRCFLQADSPRVNCPEHGPTVAQVPWARHGAGHTRDFDDQVAWLVTHTPKSTVCELMRIAWRTRRRDHRPGGGRRPGRPRPLRGPDPHRASTRSATRAATAT